MSETNLEELTENANINDGDFFHTRKRTSNIDNKISWANLLLNFLSKFSLKNVVFKELTLDELETNENGDIIVGDGAKIETGSKGNFTTNDLAWSGGLFPPTFSSGQWTNVPLSSSGSVYIPPRGWYTPKHYFIYVTYPGFPKILLRAGEPFFCDGSTIGVSNLTEEEGTGIINYYRL